MPPAPAATLASCNALLASLARSGRPAQALRTFRDLLGRGVPPDHFTLTPVLRSCALTGATGFAASSHALAVKLGAQDNLFVASALVLCYAGLSNLPDARRLFDGMRDRDAVLWTSMLSAYAQGGEPDAAVRFFGGMVAAGMELDAVVMVSLLLACGQLGWRRHGRSVHACCVRRFLGLPLSLGNALVDMYVKCGDFAFAERVFAGMRRRDVISWSALILGHGLNGRSDVALGLFDRMSTEGVQPNSVTFLGALSACAHSGMVDKGYTIFEGMKQRGIEPELKHYSCMADMLGRAGRVVEAVKLIEEMPFEPDEAMLGGVLAACRVHGEMEAAEQVSKRLMDMSPGKSGYYMSLANIYSDAGRYNDAERIRGFMKEVKVNKLPGYSSVELDVDRFHITSNGV
ncbi:Pentatricopeptide repeat-containing protein [Dichanthelium oligosanthes]|uniref:Pentatricopeptide repeat-containing protein n=1 Tax=Dichanthelium oligosanthes TaxID=888268 RepID=A0A1E5W9E5_9POAL|nr:Pentatricopeptide repeat-containing protein [Dichanthelium oligosanthes]